MRSAVAMADECASEPPHFLVDVPGRPPVNHVSLEVLFNRAFQTITPSHLMLELWIEAICCPEL